MNLNSDDIVLDGISAHDCTRSSASWLFTYNTGKFVEGLSVLADVSGDAQWKSLYVAAITVWWCMRMLIRLCGQDEQRRCCWHEEVTMAGL